MKLYDYLNKNTKIDILKWQKFKLLKYFDYEKGKDKSPTRKEIDLDLGVLCAVAKNNNSGYSGRKINPIKVYDGIKLLLVSQGDGGAGMCFLSNEPCCANSCVILLLPKTNIILNKYIGLFLATVISTNKQKFDFSKGINRKFLENLYIKLPVDLNGEPDWEYMENYVKNKWKSILDNLK